MSSSRLKRLQALEKRDAGALSDDPHQLTDAQLFKIAGLPADATDEDLERIAAAPEGRADDGSCP